MSQKNYAHFVITRFNIPANYAGHKNKSMNDVDPKTDVTYLTRRVELFKKYTFPSLKNQTDQNFKWLVLFSDATPALIREELDKLQEEFQNFCPLFLTDEEAYNFDEYLAGIIGKVDAKAYITTRIDNDDAMNIHMIYEIHKYFEEHNKTNVLVSFPYGLQYMEEKKLYSNFHLFGNHFISLILPTSDKTVISFPHNKLPKEIEKLTLGGKKKDPMWIEIIHGTNYANQQSFHIGKALKSTKVFDGFSCDIELLNYFGVVRNVLVSIPVTVGLIVKVLKQLKKIGEGMADYQKIGFVILHYNAIKETMDCVKSIKNHIDTNLYHIVIVDNASPNGSGKDLAEAYEKDELVTVILAKENLGFAKGNNLGFDYAVNEEYCNFLCVMNNDTLVVQDDFFATILEEYHKSGFGVMGPKILLNEGKVQPLTHKMPGITFFENEIRIHKRERDLRKKHLYSFYLFGRKVKSFFLLISGHRRVSRFKPYLKLDGLDERRENVVLHGCCLIFSPKYIESYENGFFPDTFLYKEEELLYLRCKRKHLLTVYNPKLKIRHLEDVATDSVSTRKKEKQMLWLDQQIRSLEILVRELRKERD